jgi:abequosyltransferase
MFFMPSRGILIRMSEIKLSICIATRNRGAFIGATLESIISQATDEVEIVVLDGASTDNTEQVVRACQGNFPRLRYFRAEVNMGIDRDFAKVVELAHGSYCWLFSDDDLFKPGAIRVVLDAMKNDYSLIIANGEVRSADLTKILEARKLPFDKNRVYKPNENHRIMAEAGQYLSFIGCVIIKKQLWAEREKESYFGSYFIHVGIIFQRPFPGDVLAIAEPLISLRYANASWASKFFDIWMFKWPNLIWSFPDFPDSVKAQVWPKEPWRSPKSLMHFRARGVYTIKEYEQWLRPRLKSYWSRASSRAIAHFPGRLANLIVYVYHSIVRLPSRLLTQSDLANSPYCFWKFPARGGSLVKRSTSSRSPELQLPTIGSNQEGNFL